MISWRMMKEKLYFSLCLVSTTISCTALFVIIAYNLLGGLPSLNWYFLTTAESATPHIGMAIGNAIAGTILLSIFSTILATPLALGTAIYLQRYAKDSTATRAFRFLLEVLSGTPSIVLGVFGLLVLVYYMKFYFGGFSLISGSIALAILIMPVIERALEHAISCVPREIEEGSYALGANIWQTICGITIPAALPGLFTGAILGFGRAAEESAVVILTAGYSQFMPELAIRDKEGIIFGLKLYPFQHAVGSLPYSVYHAYENSNVIPISNGFAAAFVLIVFVLCINVTAKIVLHYTTATDSRRSKGTGRRLSTVFSNLKKIPARFSRQMNPDTTTGSIVGKSPDIVLFGIRIPHRSPVAQTGIHMEKQEESIDGGNRERGTTIDGKLSGTEGPNPEPATDSAGTSPFDCAIISLKKNGFFEDAPRQQPFGEEPLNESTHSASAGPKSMNPDEEPSSGPSLQGPATDPMPIPGVDRTEKPTAGSGYTPPARPHEKPSITDGFAGVIIGCAGMAGFLGFVYGVRWYTKDATLELGSIILALLLIAIVLATVGIQYLRLRRERR